MVRYYSWVFLDFRHFHQINHASTPITMAPRIDSRMIAQMGNLLASGYGGKYVNVNESATVQLTASICR